MAISINPIFPVIAAQGVPADAVLQPGTVIDAQVMKQLADNAVRIAIAHLSIEVMSEIPLEVGQTLRLAVSQTPDGIRLAVVGPQQAATGAAKADTVTLSPAARIEAAAVEAPQAPSSGRALTAMEALAVSAAAQAAAARQAGLSQFFANVQAAAIAGQLPPALRQAAQQLLALRVPLDAELSGEDIARGLRQSGLFLEQGLAAGLPPSSAGGAMPDLKAALLIFRQLLSLQLGGDGASSPPSPATTAGLSDFAAAALANDAAAAGAAARLGHSPGAPLMPELETQEILLPQARLPVAADTLPSGGGFTAGAAAPLDAAATRIALNLLQETLGGSTSSSRASAPVLPAEADATVQTMVPPPPLRGAAPAAQIVAAPSIAPDAAPVEVLHRLQDDTDAALARQTLLQIASLPDRTDSTALRSDPLTPRWHFEIPFAAPGGTAVAQFAIARDGGGNDTEPAKRIWRARFSLDVEPAGPVHVVISLAGETTSVRMWAERPATAQALKADLARLSHALSLAELRPGDITVSEGAPPQKAPAQAGHFLDRAS